MTTAIIYFSRANENYINGKKQMLLIGNTAVLAQKLSERLKLSSYQIIPKVPYSIDYEETVQKANREKQNASQVAYEAIEIDLKEVETVFLGFPNWWGTYPRIIATFLANQDWENKTIYPFCTHEGSAFGSSIQDLTKACPGAEIKTGLAVRGSKTNHSDTALANWLLAYEEDQ